MKNYTFIKKKYIDEIESTVSLYKHNKSGARVCTIENDDQNKVFSIAFRTPAINNSGLTHILEHSVLCGSKKYPVKDPFVELLKSSLNTFLNAFTFPDKTMYPVASLNQKDFRNLMSVYMDAVFYPNIYKYEEIFRQEGWRYDIKDKNEDIKYNGVVYNEMRGAFSNPEETLSRLIMHSLFPDTSYGLESGGDPKYIPDLDYKEFLKFHSEYYSPSNSYIYIYGDCDMNERMEWMDKEYLSKFDVVDFDTEIKTQSPFDKPKSLTESYQTTGTLENKTFLSYNVVMPSVLNIKEVIAMKILVDSLFNVPGAPLKEAIQNENIGEDVSAYLEVELLQPLLSISVVGANESDEERFISIIDRELNKYIKEGLNKKTIEALINAADFENREKDFSSRMPKGLLIAISGLSSWLYTEDGPYMSLEIIKYYKELRKEINTNYFESLLDKYILNNNHKSYVKLVPSLDTQLKEEEFVKEKLRIYKESLSDSELEELINKNKKLEEYQNTPSTKEELDTLPKLELDDIDKNPEELNLEVINDDYKVLYSNYKTNGITYLSYLFDITGVSPIDAQYISLYTDLFKELSTSSHSYFEINQTIISEFGSINASLNNLADKDGKLLMYLGYGVVALNEKMKEANDMLLELINETIYTDYSRIYQKLGELKNSLEMGISRRGNAIALTRALSRINEYQYYKDMTSCIGYLDFIKDLYNNFESKKEEISNKLSQVKGYLAKSNFTLGVIGDNDVLSLSKELSKTMYHSIKDSITIKPYEYKENPLNEAIIAPYNVNYVARCGKYNDKYNYSSLVLENAISMDYLWNSVRVNGGAYGVGLLVSDTGYLGFTSYRDPNIDRTLKAYENTIDYINTFDPTEEDILAFKIGAASNLQSVSHNKVKGLRARNLYLQGITYEMRKTNRMQMINATKEDLKNTISWYKEALSNSNICVIGNKDSIDKSNVKFDEIREL